MPTGALRETRRARLAFCEHDRHAFHAFVHERVSQRQIPLRIGRCTIGLHAGLRKRGYLARQQLRIAIEELLKKTSHFELCGNIKMSGMPEVGPISVPLRMRPS